MFFSVSGFSRGEWYIISQIILDIKWSENMNKTDLTHQLERELWKHTKKRGTFGCFEVTIGWYGKERVDYLTYDTKGIFRCYEVKASKVDFYSSNKVSFVGHYNYYVIPVELYKEVKEDIDSHIGVFASDEKKLSSIKRAKKQDLGVCKQVLKDSMIRSLYRESEKVISNNDTLEIETLRKELNESKRKAYQNYKQHMDLRKKLYKKYGESWKEDL